MRTTLHTFILFIPILIITAIVPMRIYSQEQWIEMPQRLTESHFIGSMVLLQDNRILLIGGKTSGSVISSSAEIFDPLTKTLSSAGTMSTARYMMKAVLLRNGKVLVMSGSNYASVLSSCELYDPTTNTWTQTGSMFSSRSRFTATLLKDGRVLVTGGNNGSPISGCEIYDASTGTWSIVPSLPQAARNSHTAALLPDGRVLVTDGYSGISSRSHIFNPATNSWSSTGSLQTRGSGDHTLTLLPNGKLLLVGGWPSALSRAEIYDPVTGLWASTQPLQYKRAVHSSLLLPSGRTLISGGIDAYSNDQNEFSLASTELFSYVNSTWFNGPSLPIAMDGFGACVLANGRVILAGGGQKTSSSYFNPQTSLKRIFMWQDVDPEWTIADTLPSQRIGHTLTSLPNNKVLAVGGSPDCEAGQIISACNLYDFATKSWTTGAELHEARMLHTATLLPDGELIIAGGKSLAGAISSTETYSFTTDTWLQVSHLLTARFQHTATLLMNGELLVVGGTQGLSTDTQEWDGLATCEAYNPIFQRWKTIAPMSIKRFGHTATLLPNGNVLVVGGRNKQSEYLSTVEIYNPSLNVWTTVAPMSSTRMFHTATLLPTGEVLVVGGRDANGAIAKAETYNYRTNVWSSADVIDQARFHHTATLLHNGDVLVTGGAILSNNNATAIGTASIYHIANSSWSTIDSLPMPCAAAQSVLLPDNTIFIVGGYRTTSCIGSSACFIYDSGLGYQQQERPVITSMSPTILENISGSGYIPITINGMGFQDNNRSGSEAGGTNVYGTATNYPIVEIRRIGGSTYDNDFIRYLPFNTGNFQWSDTSTQVRIDKKQLQEQALPSGYYRLAVSSNGVSSFPVYFSIPPSSLIFNTYTAVTEISASLPHLSVDNPMDFAPNDKVLIIQMQGANIDTTESLAYGSILSPNQAGNFEFSRIESISDSTIILSDALKLMYDVQGKVQLVKVPEYQSMTLSAVATCQAWNGKTGGILAISAVDSLILKSDIDISGKGFRGGIAINITPVPNFEVPYYRYTSGSSLCANKGEGIAGYGLSLTAGRGAPANGGGGGNNYNAGGGGGANLTCGGNGGWAYNNGMYSGDNKASQGLGGHLLTPTVGKVFMGGGGGAGHGDNQDASSGGNGGGIAILEANILQGNNHTIYADGYSARNSENDGAGGGGAGGSILLNVESYQGNITASSKGGNGGNVQAPNIGPGGGGGGGTIYFSHPYKPDAVITSIDSGQAGKAAGGLYGNSSGCSGDTQFNLQLLQGQDTTTTLRVKALIQGLWNGLSHRSSPVAVELRTGGATPLASVLSTRATAMISSTGTITVALNNISTGYYWIVVRHSGSLPVSSSQQQYIISGSTVSYDFSDKADKAYEEGTILVSIGTKNYYILKSGDFTGDQAVSPSDISILLSGYPKSNGIIIPPVE